MESLRIERKDIYTIEVNDKGETIEFDLVDVELPFKCEKAWAEVNKISKELQAQLVIINKQEDTKQNGKLLTMKEEKTIEAHRKAFREMRVARVLAKRFLATETILKCSMIYLMH